MDKINLLLSLGLSPNQAKVYQSILKLGNATAIQMAESSSVYREDIYKVLPALEKLGLVEKLLGKPAIFRATPVDGALSSLIVDEKVKSDERIASMKAKFKKISEAKWVLPIRAGNDKSLYALIPEGKPLIAKLASLTASSRTDIFWMSTLNEICHVITLIFDEIKRASHRGVAFKVIIENFDADKSQRKQVQHIIDIDSANIRVNHQTLNRFLVFDNREAMIPTTGKSTSEANSALWTTDTNLIGVLRGYFETSWSESEELKQINATSI